MKALKKIVMLMAVLACVVAIGGCAGRGSLSDEPDDATGGYTVKADDAGKGAAIGSLGGISVKEGQVFVIRPNLEKGSLQVKLSNAAGETVVDEKASGNASTVHELEPGDYSMSVTCNEDGTTGTMLIAPMNKADAEK